MKKFVITTRIDKLIQYAVKIKDNSQRCAIKEVSINIDKALKFDSPEAAQYITNRLGIGWWIEEYIKPKKKRIKKFSNQLNLF